MRRLRNEVISHIGLLPDGSRLVHGLGYVVWELLMNLRHGEIHGEIVVVVVVESRRITVRLPGPIFDSVAKAKLPDARGLETSAWLLGRCGWKWTHHAADGANEVWLEGIT